MGGTQMIFVGERQSPKAARYGHTCENGKAASATLHRALLAAGVDVASVEFANLWRAPGLKDPKQPPSRATLRRLRAAHRAGQRIVAMGALVQRELTRLSIPHVPIIHPAARGKMRKAELYDAHVRDRLCAS
jgi:hypothetical protein